MSRVLGIAGVALAVLWGAACGSEESGTAPGGPGGDASTDASADAPGAGDAGADGASADGGGDAAPVDGGADAGPIVTSTYVTKIAASEDVVCAIARGGALRCWGGNLAPATLEPGSTWKDVAVGGARGTGAVTLCAVRADDSLRCWSDLTSSGAQPDSATFAAVGVAQSGRCAVSTTGGLYCWGQNTFGSLGVGDTSPRSSPTRVGTDSDWKVVSPGGSHTCATKGTGALYCWGWNAFYQLGDGTNNQRTSPVPVDAANTYLDVSVRNVASCAVRSDGALVCWGTNGPLGFNNVKVPTAIDSAQNWAKVRLSNSHACATKTDGSLYCWGDNDRGQIGLPIAVGSLTRSSPQQVGADRDWADVAVGEGLSCGVKKDGTVRCWGTNGRGQLAQSPAGHLEPKRVGAPGEFAWVNAGPKNVCAVRKDGTLACWGRAGALPAAGISAQVPVTIGAATDWKTAKSGYAGACAAKADGALHCWANGATPAPVGLTVSGYDLGYNHQCAIASGSLYCWGEGIFGKLGNGSNQSLAAPTKVGADSYTALAVTENTSCAIKSTGALVCFGFGYSGFAQQGAATTWTALEGSPIGDMYAGLQGASLYRWGFAVAVAASGAENDWVKVAAGAGHVCGIRASGGLFCKGENEQGQLGDGTLARRDTLAQVGTATDWTHVTASGAATCGLRGAGDLHCWGSNDYGELGDGTALFPPGTVVP